ncbi:MAG TPA: anti-sigma factor [Acetobacteraceae bacterium]|jgi:anti-sigma factor RsiW|nr:anti-sigma factor [Acetobacteraceae bacterium]
MTAAERPISEDELHAYVDERLDRVRRQEVEHYLDAQPEQARRVAAYRAQRDGLRAALASRAAEPVPPELNLSRLLEARLRQRHGWWRLAASVILCLCLGGAAGWYLGLPAQPTRTEVAVALLQQQAMASHTVYASDKRHPIEVVAAEKDHLTQWLSNRLHRSIVPPDLSSTGYRLLGGRLLATEHGGAAALFVYDDAQGNRLSVLMRPMAPELHATRSDYSQGTTNACMWIVKGIGFAVVGAAPDRTLDQIADQISRQVTEAG